jgi:hypothetical protein
MGLKCSPSSVAVRQGRRHELAGVDGRTRPMNLDWVAQRWSAKPQQRRQTPQDAQQPPPPQPPQPPQPRQPRHPRHPPQPRQPPQRQPQAICWKPAAPPCSLSNRWNVARLASEICSSPRSTDWLGEKFSFCVVSAFGRADAEAPPASEKVRPAAPNAGTAALVTRFRVEACFDIVASPPIPVRADHYSSQHDPTLKATSHARLSSH